MVVSIKCAVFCYPVAPQVNFSEEIIKYFELELEGACDVRVSTPVTCARVRV